MNVRSDPQGLRATRPADGGANISIPEALARAIALHREALNGFVAGNATPWKQHCSHRDDVTVIGAWGGFEKGWAADVEKRYEWAAGRFLGSKRGMEVENISLVVTAELAYSVDIERALVRVAGKDQMAAMALRVTTIFRLENGDWKMVHRHADPLLGLQTPQSVTQM
jgi:ketosteroid isomerase-like protein